MWFFGALAGLVVGGLAGGSAGAFSGAILGGIAGLIYSAARTTSPAAIDGESRLSQLETRVQALTGTLEKTNARLFAIERQLSGAQVPSDAQQGETTDTRPDTVAPLETAAAAAAPVASVRIEQAAPEDSQAAPVISAPAAETPAPSPAHVAPKPATNRKPLPPEKPFWWKWFFGGNTLVRAGVAILFVGMAFLVKYAAERAHFPIELRLASVAAGAIAMLAIGWRLREKRPGYALSMQGGGIAVLYLTAFAALRLYAMLPPTMAFVLMVGVVVASALLAVRQDAISLAVIASAGGFLAPILTATGNGSHVMLFSYYTLLNLGIFAIAWIKAWRPLNLLGFAFTFVIGALWGWKNYAPEHFSSTEPFLVIFFLLYVAIALLYALRRSLEVTHYVDGTLVFGTPIAAFGLQSQLMKGTEYGLAFSALALAALYVLLASALWKRRAQGMLLLVESFLSLGVVFATLTLPLALDGRWTSAAWALEGAAVVWIGGRQGRQLAQWFGVLLQIAAGMALLSVGHQTPASYPIANSDFLGCAFIAVAGLFCSFRIDRHGQVLGEPAIPVSYILFLWGMMWWVVGGMREINLFAPSVHEREAYLLFLAASAATFNILQRRLAWPIALVPQALLLPAMAVLAVSAILDVKHPLAGLGVIAWPFAFAALLWMLRRSEDAFYRVVTGAMHAGGLWLAAGLACWETAYWIDDAVAGAGTWPFVAWAIVPGLVLAGLSRYATRITWPVAKHLALYLQVIAAPVAAYLFCWILFVNVESDGDPSPLPYVPLLNPLDLAMLLILLALAAWYLRLRALALAANVLPRYAGAVIGVTAFIWLNGSLLRTLHHWAGIPYERMAMYNSMLAQTCISVFWTVLACGLMLFATRRGLRTLWLVGGALLVAVVAKLFIIDLSQISGIERIVSFIVVGILLLAIGYFSPVPPQQMEEKS